MSLKLLTEKIIQYIDQKTSNTQIDLDALLENHQARITDWGEHWVYFKDNYSDPLNAGYYVYDLDMNHSMREVSLRSYYVGYVEVKMLSYQETGFNSGVFFPVLRKVTYYVKLDEDSGSFGSSTTYKLNTAESKITKIKTYLLLKDRPRVLMYTKLMFGFGDRDINDRFVYLGSLLGKFETDNIDTDASLFTQSKMSQIKPLNEIPDLELYGSFINGFTTPRRSSVIAYPPSVPLTHLQTKIETDVKQMLGLT